jgi:hypothetical protein
MLDESTSWAMFCWQFMIVAEHNYWPPCEKATYLIAALNKPAAHILHGVPTGVTQEEVTDVIVNHYGDHHLEAANIEHETPSSIR